MDITVIKKKAAEGILKYRYVILVVAVGLVLMLLPSVGENREGAETVISSTEETTPDLSLQLSQILSKIDGAGKVEVMLTVAAGETTVYQYDEHITGGESGSIQHDTVIITDNDRGQSALVQQINPPVYLGAIIVCEGADSASVRLSIIEAVARVTGLGTDRISVLKMK